MQTYGSLPKFSLDTAGRLAQGLRNLLRRFNLRSDMQEEESIIQDLTRGAEITGTNLWLLITAILIASVGLNVNSTAVVIGAMLISPLMGPIMAIALGVATYRFSLIQRAAKSLGFAVLASVLASTLYFLISPMTEAQSELLARTNPSIWDVLIAFIGGLAGMVGASRKQHGNVVPGVAIATALMPPLCTAGFGLATLQPEYFLGAFYLFFINSVFICLGGVFILKFLRLHPESVPDPRTSVILKRATATIVLVTMIPSLFLTYRIVRETFFKQAANRFLSTELQPYEVALVSREIHYKSRGPKIHLTYLGSTINQEKVKELESRLTFYGLQGTELILKPAIQDKSTETLSALRTGLLEELIQKTKDTSQAKDDRIRELEARLSENSLTFDLTGFAPELSTQVPGLKNFTLARSAVYLEDGSVSPDQWILTGRIQARTHLSAKERKRIQNWLRIRFKAKEADLRFL